MFRTGRSIRFLLAGVVLLAGVPAWRHAHVGGDRPHSHAHEHDHDGLGESHAHLHVVLFGVECTIPLPADEDDSRAGHTTFLVSAPIVMDAAQSFSHFATLAPPAYAVGEPVQAVPTFRCIAASAAPLSDNARHERSGVLLI